MLTLRAHLQDNLITYLSEVTACEFHGSNLDDEVIDTVCQIVIDTFNSAFFAPAPSEEN